LPIKLSHHQTFSIPYQPLQSHKRQCKRQGPPTLCHGFRPPPPPFPIAPNPTNYPQQYRTNRLPPTNWHHATVQTPSSTHTPSRFPFLVRTFHNHPTPHKLPPTNSHQQTTTNKMPPHDRTNAKFHPHSVPPTPRTLPKEIAILTIEIRAMNELERCPGAM